MRFTRTERPGTYLLGTMLVLACSSPLPVRGSGGAPSGGGTSSGTGGLRPVTIDLALGGRPGTGGGSGRDGMLGLGGRPATGGSTATGGAPATSTTDCTAGRCLVTLAAAREQVWPGLAVGSDSVYWTEQPGWIPGWPGEGDGRVMKVPMNGGAPTVLASDQDFPAYVRVDATSVYWTTWSTGIGGELMMYGHATVARAPLDGGEASAVIDVELLPDPGSAFGRSYADIAVDATSVYWAYRGERHNDLQDGAILQVALLDGKTTTLAAAQWRPYQIAVDASSAYWVNGTSQDDTDSVLLKVSLAGGAVTTLDTRPSGHTAFALGATHVYWTSSDGTVTKLPLAGGLPVTLATGQAAPTAIAVDTDHVYWANRDDGTIMKLALAGGMPTTLVTDQPWPLALAVDATSLYWTTDGTAANDYRDGTVMKLTPK